MVALKDDRVQSIYRLPLATLEKFKAKVVKDQMSMQRAFEIFVKEYTEGNLDAIIKKYASEKNAKLRRYSMDVLEAEAVFDRLAAYSPLKDTVRVLDREVPLPQGFHDDDNEEDDET